MADPSKLPIKTETSASATSRMAPLDNLRREIDYLFDSVLGGDWRLPFSRTPAMEIPWPRRSGWEIMPAVDMSEKPNAYEIAAELPGLEEKDVEVKLANGVLTIKGEKREEKEEKEKDYYLSERRYGSFVRSFRLPEGIDESKIEATFAKGVLTVTLPKTAEAKSEEKKISIKAA